MTMRKGRLPVLVVLPFVVACGDLLRDPPRAPTYAEDVAPILHERCASCHRPEGPAPFSLLTYDDARAVSSQIADAVAANRMPPWLPVPGDVAFEGDRTLSEIEKATIYEWTSSGEPSGELTLAEPPVLEGGWALGPPDRVLETAEPFPVPATGEDIFRNLVIPVPISSRQWVRGIEIRFTDPSVVHHAMVTMDATSSSRRMDGLDQLPGFDGMFVATEAVGPSGFLLGWTPGKEATLSPQDLAFPIDPGTDIVLQLHLRPHGEATDIGATLGLHLADEPPSRAPFTIRLGTEDIDIPAGEASFIREDAYVLPVPVEVLGLYPHAHYLGREILLRATLPDSTRMTLLEIPAWDFNWQDAYRLKEPLELPAGTRMRATFRYDNSADNPLNPHRPPQRVVYGPRSTDEMGELWIQVVPRVSEDLPLLVADFGEKNLISKIEGWRHMLALNPGEPTAHAGLGTVAQSEGRHEEAIEHFKVALAARPDYLIAHYNLGVSLEQVGRLDEAIAEFELVTRIDRGHAPAHNNLGIIEAEAGHLDRAVAHFEAATHGNPNHLEALNNLGNALRQSGDLSGAAQHLERALDLSARYAAARFNLALVAWALATDPDPNVRDGTEAVRLAERAVRDWKEDYRLLDVLAAAYAERGRFKEATAAASRAVQLIESSGEASGAEGAAIGFRLRMYAQQQPFRTR